MGSVYTKRDRQASRYVHRLFWQANLVDGQGFVLWILTRPAATFIYNIIIPFQIAYGLQAIVTKQFDQISVYALRVFLLGAAYSILWTIGGVAVCRNGKLGTEYLQQTVFSNYLNKDYEFFNSTFVGSLGSQAMRLKDTFNDYCVIVMNGVVKQVIVVGASIAIIAYQSLLLAAVTLVSMVVILSFTIVSGRWRLKYRRLLSQANSDLAGVVGDALGHGATVKSFAAEDFENQRLRSTLSRLVQTQYWSWMSSIPADAGRMLLATGATATLLVLAANLYQKGTISIAIVVLVQLYVIKLVAATHDIADLIKSYESVMSSAHQAAKTMLINPEIVDPLKPKKLTSKSGLDIELQKISYRYDDAKNAVMAIKNCDLTIKQGEKIGIVGYSGSGKTTLTKLLLRFMDVSSGSIKVGGLDIREMTQKELRSYIAYVPQEPLLFHRSVAENIAYGKPGSSTKAMRTAGAAAYVDEFVSELSDGYDTLVGERGVKLSGGQRQRVAIARALLKNSPILVLDEATSALDSRSEQYIQKALWQLMQGRTALVIAHRLSTLQRMDRIVVMDKGKIIEQGTHTDLIAIKNGAYAKLWSHQSGGYIAVPAE